LYAETHEWVHVEDKGSDKIATVGITAHAVEQLTDLIFMELPPIGSSVSAGNSFGEVESVKATSNLYSPVTGEVVEVNADLPNKLEMLNSDPYGAAWIMKVRLTDSASLSKLMNLKTYEQQTSSG
jgi:glycine cleavage system H protein